MTVRTRFAPSPTGFLHVGGVRTALFAWLFARKHGGQFILRIEDTDKVREKEGSIGHIIESLKWLGVEWDEGIDIGGPYEPYLQSARTESHHKYARQLLEAGLAYPDPYTEEEVEAFRTQAEAEKRPFLYRDHRPTTFMEWDGKRPLRFKIPEIKRYEWNDLARGTLSAGEEALDDFVIIKGDGYATYNFAHIIDDFEMKVTHIMRADEFISSTPKYLALYEALDIKRPEIVTLPPILGPDGKKKLSKRDGAKDVLDYRAEGLVPGGLMNFLVLLGWHPEGDQEILTKDDLVKLFDVDRIQKSGARFDTEKLLFINREHMRMLSDEDYMRTGEFDPAVFNTNTLRKVIPILKERAHTFQEAREMLQGELACLFSEPTLDRSLLVAKGPQNSAEVFTKDALSALRALIEHLPENGDVDSIKTTLMQQADQNPKEQGGRGAILWPLRYALSGQERSPDPFTLIHILGVQDSLLRIDAALGILGE